VKVPEIPPEELEPPPWLPEPWREEPDPPEAYPIGPDGLPVQPPDPDYIPDPFSPDPEQPPPEVEEQPAPLAAPPPAPALADGRLRLVALSARLDAAWPPRLRSENVTGHSHEVRCLLEYIPNQRFIDVARLLLSIIVDSPFHLIRRLGLET
jgi:hypothetical protein